MSIPNGSMGSSLALKAYVQLIQKLLKGSGERENQYDYSMNWTQRLARYYRTHLEPLFYKSRLNRRLSAYQLDVESSIPAAKLDGALGCPCSQPLCHHLFVTYGGYLDQFFYSIYSENAPLYSKLTLHAIDLLKYESFDEYRTDLGKRSSFFLRDAKRAGKLGYAIREFDLSQHIESITQINHSLRMRSFGPVWPQWMTQEDFGDEDFKKLPHNSEPCNLHWDRFIGVFAHAPNSMQGDTRDQARLVGYARLQRVGNLVAYEDLIGHRDFLTDGIMKLLHCHILHWLLDSGDVDTLGLEYLIHGSVERGGDGIFFWKKKALFAPYLIDIIGTQLPEDFDEEEYLKLNPDVAMSGLTAASHYKIYGQLEQRIHHLPSQGSEQPDASDIIPEDFDPELYLQLNPDVAAAGMDAATHYTLHGAMEGRCYRKEANDS